MLRDKSTVIAGLDSVELAQRAADELLMAGFESSQVALVARERGPGGSAGRSSAARGDTSTGPLADALSEFNLQSDAGWDPALGNSQAAVVVAVGSRFEDAVRILRDFGAHFASDVATGSAGYDTPATTEDTASAVDPIGDQGLGAFSSRERSWDEAHPTYRSAWESRRARRDRQWTDVEPGYRYGHQMAADPRYRGRDWDAAEPDLRRGYRDWARERGYDESESVWDRIKDGVRDAWSYATWSSTEPGALKGDADWYRGSDDQDATQRGPHRWSDDVGNEAR